MKNELLSLEEIKTLAEEIPDWEITNNYLTKSLNFKNFVEAFEFMTRVAIIAEEINHHPDWSNSYSILNIRLSSHDLGGISHLDFKLAKLIDELETKKT